VRRFIRPVLISDPKIADTGNDDSDFVEALEKLESGEKKEEIKHTATKKRSAKK
jgi:hypothetical protein